VPLRLPDHPLGHVVVMNIDGASLHSLTPRFGRLFEFERSSHVDNVELGDLR
jgi:hypothetical protein